MNKWYLIFIIIILGQGKSFCQKIDPDQLYVYPELQKAYINNTRSLNGMPGLKYWQNHSSYKIKASINPENGKITGSQEVTYFNNSPDSLGYLVIRTYPDFYKGINVKDYTIDPVDISNGMNIGSITLENNVKPDYRRAGTNIYLTLPAKLSPNKSIKLIISWDFTLPKKTQIREGTFYNSSFFVAYWYPQIAVYDDYNGWDSFNYSGLQEFYNDFNDYDVTIETPANFLLWATGNWQNPEEILSKTSLDKYLKGLTSDSVVRIIDSTSRKTSFLAQSPNSYRFVAKSVSDFSFAVSDTFIWDMISAAKGANNERVSINVLYHPSIPNFSKLAVPATKMISYLSNTWPGISYPHSHLSIFSGNGGMEFPMMINQAYINDKQALDVMSHEIAHSYFPFLVGTNERRYAWMDEGMAQTLPNDYEFMIGDQRYKPQQISKYLINYVNSFVGTANESPLMELSIYQKGQAYYFSAYSKPVLALTYFREMIGEAAYLKGIKAYVERWKYKHPSPYDFFFTFNNVTNHDYNWFWRSWFFDRSYPDVSIDKVATNTHQVTITLRQIGSLPVPLEIEYLFTDSTSITINRSVAIWEKNKIVDVSQVIPKDKKLKKINVNLDLIPDIDRKNNIYIIN